MIFFSLVVLFAARLPGDIPVDPSKMKVGESACVFPVHRTQEDNVWIGHDSVYRRDDGQSCILTLKLVAPDKWVIYRHDIPIRQQQSHDSELKKLGFIKLGSAEVLQ